jgi:signal transduction histidine kinase
MSKSSKRPGAAPHERLLEATAAGLTGLLQTHDDRAVDTLLGRLAAATDVDRAYVADHVRSTDDGFRVRVLHEWFAAGLDSARLVLDGRQDPAPSAVPLLAGLEQGRCLTMRYSELPPDMQQRFAPTKLRSVLTVPIEVDGRCWGQLGLVDCRTERSWSPEEQTTMRTLAAALGLALAGRHTHQELQRHFERIRDLHAAIATGPSPTEEQVERLLRLATRHLGQETAMVLRVRDEDVETCEVLHVHGPPGSAARGTRVPLARQDYDEAVSKRSTTAIPDFLESHAREHSVVTQHHMRSFIGVPLWVEEQPFGAVSFLSRHPRTEPFSPSDRDFAGLVGRWVSSLLEQQLSESRRKALEHRLHERDKVDSLALAFAGIAHDFGNMLMVISTNMHIARRSLERGDHAEVLESLNQADSATQRAAELKTQMLTFAGRGPVERLPIDVATIAEDLTVLLSCVMPPGVTLVFRPEDPLPDCLADATQLRQVLSNMILNSADAMRERRGIIRVSAGSETFASQPTAWFVAEDAPPGDYVWIQVEDNGVGIAPELVGRIFDPFFTTKPGERGLGLATVRGIVTGHSGCIDVESRPNVGTRIRIWLPTNG